MPRMDGVQVLRRIKADEQLRLTPVVILTSSRESLDLQECYRLGANAYVVKPVRFSEFIDAVKQTGVFWALINQWLPYYGLKNDLSILCFGKGMVNHGSFDPDSILRR